MTAQSGASVAPCTAPLVVTYEHTAGGWSSSCDLGIEVTCSALRCYWWDKTERKQITAAELVALQADHDECAREAQR